MTTHTTPSSRLETLGTSSKLQLARMTLFYLSVLAFVFFWLLAFNFQLYAVLVAWFDAALADTIHFVHDITLASWVWVWGLAMVVQLYRPAKRVTAMQVALILTIIDLGVGVFLAAVGAMQFEPDVLLFFGPVFVAAALHPARGELLDIGGFSRENVDPLLLGLTALAVVPVALYVGGQLNLQLILTDEHAELGHYATMSYAILSMVALGVLASLRNRGRRFAAYGAGLLAVMLGVASIFNPTMSGLSTTWSVLAMLWGLALIGVYELSVRRKPSSVSVDSVGSASESPRSS